MDFAAVFSRFSKIPIKVFHSSRTPSTRPTGEFQTVTLAGIFCTIKVIKITSNHLLLEWAPKSYWSGLQRAIAVGSKELSDLK